MIKVYCLKFHSVSVLKQVPWLFIEF